MNDNEKYIEEFVKDIPFDAPDQKHRDELKRELLNSFPRHRLKPTIHTSKIWRIIMNKPLTKFAAAAVIIIIVFFSIDQFNTNGSSVAWADIVQSFQSVPFFNVTIYIGYDTSAQAKKIEIWKSDNSRFRAHEENKVIFADYKEGKNIITAFDRSTGQPVNVNPDSLAKLFLEILCPEGRFSLDTIINSIPSEDGITPVITADTAASKETVVFKIKHETTPEWISIWALRDSKLPVQVRFRDPRNNECGDFFFNYSEKKEDTFFDPNAFKSPK